MFLMSRPGRSGLGCVERVGDARIEVFTKRHHLKMGLL